MAKRKSTATGTPAPGDANLHASTTAAGGNVPYIFVRDGQTVAKWAADDAIIDASQGGTPDTYDTLAACFDDYGITPRPGDELVQLAELFRAVPQVDPEYRAAAERMAADAAAGQAGAQTQPVGKPLGPKQLRAQQAQMVAAGMQVQQPQGGGVIPMAPATLPADTQAALHLVPHLTGNGIISTAPAAPIPPTFAGPVDEAARQLAEFMAAQANMQPAPAATAVTVSIPAPSTAYTVPPNPVVTAQQRIAAAIAYNTEFCAFLAEQRDAVRYFPQFYGLVDAAHQSGVYFVNCISKL